METTRGEKARAETSSGQETTRAEAQRDQETVPEGVRPGSRADMARLADGAEVRQAHTEHLRHAVARAPLVLFAVDAAGIFTLSEGQGLEALGIRPGEHVGRSFFDLYSGLPESVAMMRRALAGEPAITVEHFRGLVFETRWMPTFAADGTVMGVIGVSSDITARARAEEERDALLHREQQARAQAAEQAATLAATFDAIADGILVYDRDGRLVRANAAARITDAWVSQPDFPDRPYRERIEETMPRDAGGRVLAPEEWPISRVLRGEVLTGDEAVDTLVRRPDGRDVLLSVSGAPIRDAEGRIVGGVIVDRDVTERRRLERRAREALEALLEMAQAVVQIPDEADDATASVYAVANRLGALMRDVLDCHSVSLIGVTPENELRALACVGLPPDQVEQWRERIAQWPRHTALFAALTVRLRAGETLRIDTTRPELREIANPFGIERYLLAPMRVGSTLVGLLSVEYSHGAEMAAREDNALVEAVATLAALVLERERLLREREEARSSALALREANRRMDEFLGVASHELRTPLTGLRGSLQIMQRRLERAAGTGMDDAPVAELAGVVSRLTPFLDRALHQSSVLAGLVDDLLDLSRLQAGQLALRLAPCDLIALMAQTVEERRALDPTRAIALETPPGSLWARADAERLAQAIDHYLDNALKYSAAEQTVAVGVEADGSVARIWVRDAGPGVPAADQERIWERFYQVQGTSHRSGSSVGLGLGLFISRTIIERHGGQVGIESAPGAGATFWATVPLSAPTLSP